MRVERETATSPDASSEEMEEEEEEEEKEEEEGGQEEEERDEEEEEKEKEGEDVEEEGEGEDVKEGGRRRRRRRAAGRSQCSSESGVTADWTAAATARGQRLSREHLFLQRHQMTAVHTLAHTHAHRRE